MPITDHEKLQVHSRPSSGLLMAVPIKKRRILFTRSPSPPPKSSFPIPADWDIAENKHESSELGASCSNTGTNSAHANIVKGEVASCESANLRPWMAEAFGIPEKKPESSEFPSPFPITAGNHVQVNSVTGQLDSPAECCISEKKEECPRTASSFPIIGGNTVQVNALSGENNSSELPPAAADCGLSGMKTEPSKEPGSPFSKNGVHSAPVKAKTGGNTAHEHCEFPNAKPTYSGPIEKKHEPLNTAGYSSQVNFAKATNASTESCEKPMGRDVIICPKSETLPSFNDQVSGLNLASNYLDGSRIAQEMAFTSKCAAWPVSGSIVTHSATKETSAPAMDGNMEGKLTPREGISVKQEVSELHNLHSTSSDSKAKTDAGCLCLNRSNWDLNTTMDAWEGSSACSLLKDGAADFAMQGVGVGSTPDKRLEVGLKHMLDKEPIGIDMTLENHLVQKDNHRLRLPNRSTYVVDSNPEACLDLQLRPFSLPNLSNISAEHESSRDAPFLSLGMNPMPSTSGLPVAAARYVKSEPVENDQKDAGNVQSGVLKSADLKHVKSELSERQEISKIPNPGKMNAVCSGGIKQEPLGDQSRGYVKSVEGNSSPVGQSCRSLDSQNIQMHLNAGMDVDKALNVASKPLIVNSILYPSMNMPNINMHNASSGMIDNAQSMVNQASVPGNYMSNISLTTDSDMVDKTPGLADKASIPGDDFSVSTQSSALVSKLLISYKKGITSLPEACDSLHVPPLPDSSTSTGDQCVPSEGATELAVQMDALNGNHSSQESLTNGVLGKDCESRKAVKSHVVEDKDGASSEVVEESSSTCKSDSSHVAAGAVNAVRKQCGKDDEDFEDGEVRNPALNGTGEGSSGVTEEQDVKSVGSFCPADVSALPPSLVDEEAAKLATSREADILSCKESDGGLLEYKVDPSPSPASALTADSGKKGPSKTNRRIQKDHLKNDNGLESKFKSSDNGRKRSLSSAASSKQQNADVPSLVRRNVSSESEPYEKKEGTKKDASDGGDNRRIIYLNSGFNSSTSEKRKSNSDMSISSPEERETHADVSFRRERSRSQGSRDEIYNERSRKAETERHYGHPAEKSRSEFLRNRSRTDRLNALHGDRNSNPDRLLERMNSSNGIRYSRQASATEVATGASQDGSKRLARKLTSEEMQNQTRLPCQRRSPGGRGQMPLGCHPKRAFSPSRCDERDVPDFVLRAHEEKFLRNMHELAHPRSQYVRAEAILLHRERRSLSPQRRRGGPLQIPPNCTKSSPRSQQRSTPHWSPSARASDGFNGPRELGHCRSPPPVRINRMQSPHERRRFPEEVIVRRRGSPPYHARLPDGMVDADPSREQDFPRLARGPSRNMRRFDMIDPREMMEEEYFGPPLAHNQIREFGVDDGFADDRRGDERRGPLRSFRRRCVPGDDEGESLQFLVDDGPPRALRAVRPASNEGFPEGSGRRNFDVRFRNRLGNTSVRTRDVAQEQEDNYRHHGEEWQGAAFDDGRTKRRRF